GVAGCGGAVAQGADTTGGWAGVALVRADAACPPTRREAFDRVVTNPPWGGQTPFLGRAGRDTIVAVFDEARGGAGHAVVLVDERLDAELEWADPPNLTLVVGLFG